MGIFGSLCRSVYGTFEVSAYYNENDPKAAAWLRELMKADLIAVGDVDERSIEDVTPMDVAGYDQCHFFAGIGGWSYALRLAGWEDTRRVWTGSCPCQPFSAAGKGAGFADERHLWLDWFWLIKQCHPDIIFGEQVASKAGFGWFDLVSADLESALYACAAADLCAAGVGAPHIRQRLYFVAHHLDERWQRRSDTEESSGEDKAIWCKSLSDIERSCVNGVLAESEQQQQQHGSRSARRGRSEFADSRELGDDDDKGSQRRRERRDGTDERSPWEASLVDCIDGKSRPVEPGTFPLAHGIPHRVGLLRGYGNAIVPQVAQAFIESYMSLYA